ncbi:calcium-binding protein [Pararoseomonas indoligenes]|uniref:Calcium-binding protein n=1 Tax=Roseomonas indoligenes TaxID=2820811 RepID=A0A940MYA2_9PROT|nr:hypothetical protein [Pararoseomonas indoligenes]MBP0493059.1 hypothetical protein [Pararoseomonas indoligenes]
MPPKPLPLDDLDKVVGGADIRTGSEANYIVAGDGNDFVDAGGGGDYAEGGAGNDVLMGGAGDDVLIGEAGDDVLNGGAGSDLMEGGDGNDIIGGAGDNAADGALGGAGNDVFAWSPGSGNDYFDGGQGRDIVLIQGMSLSQVQQGLQVHTPGLQMQVSGGNVSFTNAQGQAQTFSGQVSIGGETLRFDNVERIQLL